MTFIINILECVVAHPAMILVGIILCAFVYFLYQFIFQSKSGRNPFYKDLRRSPKPLVIDQADRDKVLKEGFAAKKVPDDLDAIVIGSGVGGLGAAAILSKAGKKVLVLEQHDQAGGCCHTFIEKGFEFDIGIHYIGEMRNNTVARLLLEQLTEGQLCWQDLLDEMDLVAIGESGKHKLYPHVCAGYDRWKEGILEKFPDEKEAVNKFVSLLQGVRRNMMGLIMMKTIPYWLSKIIVKTGLFHKLTSYFKYSDQSLQDVLDSLTDNMDLKAVLSYSFGDYGTLPKDASFATHASLLSHYIFGGSYPRGGASEIPFHMIPVIEKSGGKVLVRAPVSQIICREGKAVGVKVHKKSGDQEIYAPLIVSDAGILNTFTRLLPKEIASKSSIQKMLTKKKVKVGLAGLQLFVGLDGTTEELGLKSQNIWAFSGNDTNRLVQQYLDLSRDEALEADVPLLFISFPSAKDSTFNDRFPGKSVATIVSFSNFEWFKDWETERVQKRGAEYESIKQVIGRRMWNQVLGYYPQLADKVEYFEVGTPLTNNFYINSTQGEIYGLDHTKERFGNPEVAMNLRAESGIPGLLLSGQDILSDGLMGALFGGLLCASQALNRNVYQDLVNLKKNISKDK